MAGPHAFPIEVFAFTYKKKKKEINHSMVHTLKTNYYLKYL